MKFISPRTDFAFKKIFGSEQSKPILISFLNAILEFPKESVIVDLTILDPWQAPRIEGLKDTYLDVKVKTACKKEIIIEMQVINVAGFEKRVLYNTTKSYSNQINKAEDYLKLNSVIAVTILDYVLFDQTTKYLTSFQIKEKIENFVYLEDINLVFVELPKFKKQLNELISIQDKWIFFLKEADNLEFIPDNLNQDEAFKEAFYIAETSHISKKELEILDRKSMYIGDQRNMKKYLDNIKKETENIKKETENIKKEAENTKKEAENTKKEAENTKKEAENTKKEAKDMIEKMNNRLQTEVQKGIQEGEKKAQQQMINNLIKTLKINEVEAKQMLGL